MADMHERHSALAACRALRQKERPQEWRRFTCRQATLAFGPSNHTLAAR